MDMTRRGALGRITVPFVGIVAAPFLEPLQALAYHIGKIGQRTITHANLTAESLDIFLRRHPHSRLARDLRGLEYKLIEGSQREDDHVRKDRIVPYIEHYFNPDLPKGKRGLPFPGLNDGSRDALSRAQKLAIGSVALRYQNRLEDSLEMWGRVIHLLQDAASPEHVFLLNHGPRLLEIDIETGIVYDLESRTHQFVESLRLGKHGKGTILVKTSYYENFCEKEPMPPVPREIIAVTSIEDAFMCLASESKNPSDVAARRAVKRNFFIDADGKSRYLIEIISKEDAKAIASHMAPLAVQFGAGLLEFYDKMITCQIPYRDTMFGTNPLLADGGFEYIKPGLRFSNIDVYQALVQEAIDFIDGKRMHLYADKQQYDEDIKLAMLHLFRAVNIPDTHGDVRACFERAGFSFPHLKAEFNKALDSIIQRKKTANQAEREAIDFALSNAAKYVDMAEKLFYVTLPTEDRGKLERLAGCNIVGLSQPMLDYIKNIGDGLKHGDPLRVAHQFKELLIRLNDADAILTQARSEFGYIPERYTDEYHQMDFAGWKAEVERKIK